MERFNNLPELLERRRELRKNLTYAERILWHNVRKSQLGARIRRQHSFQGFILDFYCAKLQLAIEVDGDTHLDEEVMRYDAWRQAKLEAMNIYFLRVPNPRLWVDADQVCNEIIAAIEERQRTFVRPKYSKRDKK